MVKGIHHISMKCTRSELETALSLYRDILGLKVACVWNDGVMLDAGNCLIEIFTTGGNNREVGAVRHFAFAVDDVDALVAQVRSAGYEVFVEPKEICIPSEPLLPARVAFFFGALGEEYIC